MKRPLYFIGLMISIIVGLSIVQVSVANSLSTTGITLSNLQDEIKVYQKKNALLHEKILAKTALNTIAKSAEKEGFVESATAMYFSAPLPIAKK